MADLTREQRNAIRSLRRLAKRWPDGLWLFAAGTDLCIMAEPEDGQERHHPRGGGVRQDLIVESVNIPCDGGDW